MARAHLVIARAGASTVAELTVLGRPAILVPLPHALDNDQLHNATRLAESGGGWCIEQKVSRRSVSPRRSRAWRPHPARWRPPLRPRGGRAGRTPSCAWPTSSKSWQGGTPSCGSRAPAARKNVRDCAGYLRGPRIMQMPRQSGTFHIVGIGGIGMSAIAEILLARGFGARQRSEGQRQRPPPARQGRQASSSATTRRT